MVDGEVKRGSKSKSGDRGREVIERAAELCVMLEADGAEAMREVVKGLIEIRIIRKSH